MDSSSENIKIGLQCGDCGHIFDEECGNPRLCEECKGLEKEYNKSLGIKPKKERSIKKKSRRKITCPKCTRRIKPDGLMNHVKDFHGDLLHKVESAIIKVLSEKNNGKSKK